MPVLVRSNVRRTLATMALPMLAGTFAMNAYHLTDTWFIAQLGTDLLVGGLGLVWVSRELAARRAGDDRAAPAGR